VPIQGVLVSNGFPGTTTVASTGRAVRSRGMARRSRWPVWQVGGEGVAGVGGYTPAGDRSMGGSSTVRPEIDFLPEWAGTPKACQGPGPESQGESFTGGRSPDLAVNTRKTGPVRVVVTGVPMTFVRGPIAGFGPSRGRTMPGPITPVPPPARVAGGGPAQLEEFC